MKKTIISSALMLSALGMMAQQHYTINGVCKFNGIDKVYLEVDNGKGIAIDSANVVDNKFVMKGTVDEPALAVICSKSRQLLGYIFLEEGELSMDGQLFASGGKLNQEMMNLMTKDFEEIRVSYEAGKIDGAGAEKLMREKMIELFGKHTDDPIGTFIVSNGLDEEPKLALELYEKLSDKQKQYYKFESLVPQWKSTIGTKEGSMFVDFSAEYNGKTTKLSDYVGKGKYVLVDFWASWCGPCKREIPFITAAYEKYKDKGLVVLGVATWDKPEDTERAIQELGLKYPQIINAQKAGSDAYGINGIPHLILFAPDGTILKRGLRGAAIDSALSPLFK